MRLDYWNSPRGAELNSLTLACIAERIIAHEPGATLDAVVEGCLGQLLPALGQITRAAREPDSPSGRRLRQGLSDQIRFLVEDGHIREVKNAAGEVGFETTRSRG